MELHSRRFDSPPSSPTNNHPPQVPAALREQLASRMAAAGIPIPDSEARWGAALEALKGVWASKYNDRAFYSLRKCGIDADDVRMAVCVMRVVPARYAFVIHTKNPQTNDSSEVGSAGGRQPGWTRGLLFSQLLTHKRAAVPLPAPSLHSATQCPKVSFQLAKILVCQASAP